MKKRGRRRRLRPTPEALTPPKGTRRSRSIQQFTHTVPASMRSATRCARLRFSVQSVAARPYGVALAIATASFSVLNGVMVTTGPKISSWFVRQDMGRLTITVG